jgi:hypothetical protein
VLSGRRSISGWLAALVAAVGGSVSTPGCGQVEHLSLLGDTVPEAGGASFVPGMGSGPPMCSLGPNGGVCACVDQPLLADVPNLYFVLDRSRSMNEFGKWATIVNVVSQVVIALGPRVNVGVAVFPSPDGGCKPGGEVVPVGPGDAPAGTIGPKASALLNILGRIGASGGTPTAQTLTELLPLLQRLNGKTYVVLATDGGPNCNANVACSADQCQANIEALPGCVATTNCCDSSIFGGLLSCNDAGPTTQAVQAIATAGFPVYVVGVPGSAPYATLLDSLATAGGTARGPVGTEPQYYDVRTPDESALRSALFQVAAKVAGTCKMQLDQVPPNPSQVNVFLDEQPLPSGEGCTPVTGEAGENAATCTADAESDSGAESEWNLDSGAEAGSDSSAESDSTADSGADAVSTPTCRATSASASSANEAGAACNWTLEGRTITILGDACARIMAGDVLDVRVVAGCPTVIR